jgi:hypothetical protein
LPFSKPTASRDLELLRRIKVFTKVGSTGKGTYYVLSRKGLTKGSGVSSQNGIHMGHSKSPKTQGVIKGSKGTLPKASSHKKKNSKQDVNKTNRTSRHGAMKPSKSRKLKRTVKAAKKAPKKQSKNK